jgi:hypothetical protein
LEDRLSKEDEDWLRLLALGHYVIAGLETLAGFLPSFHLAMGLWLLTSDVAKAKNGTPAVLFGSFFTLIAVTWMLLAWSLAACILIAGRSLAGRTRRTFCLVVAGVEAMLCIPFGTVLGAFTIIVLLRPAVREVFEVSGQPPSRGGSGPRPQSPRGSSTR